MSKSIFSYLVSYVPTDKRESREDYLTQMFAWILENIEGVSACYVQFLCAKIGISLPESTDGLNISISTQTTVPSGRIDLLLRVNQAIGFICEHKVHSELSENQIQKYIDDSSILGTEKYYSVLLTFSTLQHTQKADVSIIWSDIYEFIERILPSYSAEDAFVLKQFMKYLAENGMGKAELISLESMLGYWPAMKLEANLDMIFRQIVESDFEKLCPGIKTIGTNYHPSYKRSRWGRIGIDFFSEWDMGLFAGVLLDTADHALPPVDVDKGPDFVVFLESIYSKTNSSDREIYEKNIHSAKYINLISTLEKTHGAFDFTPGIMASPWRIAVLRKPLYDVLYGKYTQKEQYEALQSTIVEAINMFISGLN